MDLNEFTPAAATLMGAIVASISGVIGAWITHFFTGNRERARLAAEERREQEKVRRETREARNAILRGHLERIVTLVQRHVSFEFAESMHNVQLSAAAAKGTKYEGELDRRDGEVRPLDEANALAALYFPELDRPLVDLIEGTKPLLSFKSAVLQQRSSNIPELVDAMTEAYRPLRMAERKFIGTARAIIERDLLLPDAVPVLPASGSGLIEAAGTAVNPSPPAAR